MKNYFKIHKLRDDRKEMSKDFITLTHVNAQFVSSVNTRADWVHPKSVVFLVERMKHEGSYCIFLASKETGTERFLGWEEIEEKLISKRDSVLEDGRAKLDKIMCDLIQQMKDIEEEYSHANKLTLHWKLVGQAQIEKNYLEVHNTLKQHKKQYANGDFHLYVDNFYDNHVYHQVSADDFVL